MSARGSVSRHNTRVKTVPARTKRMEMRKDPVPWPRGQSFCGDQSKSLRLLLGSTYWHIQMPSVYCENRSIGWNNTAADDNVPVRDDLWNSFGFTDSGAFMCFSQQLQSPLLCKCHFLHTPPIRDRSSSLSSGFPTAIFVISLPSASCTFPTTTTTHFPP